MAAPRPAAAGELDRSGAPAGADPALLAGGGAPAAGVAVAAEEADDLDDAGFEPQLATPAHLNVNRLSRLLRREDLSLRNCLLSIEADAEWVARAAAQLPPLPLVANLRSGRWYVPHPEAECYFKSTDGHSGNWSFSLSRLNWHVAELAVGRGGAVVVDATRSPTKRFPDALAKTLPIWAAVLNAAAARLQGCAPPRSWLPPWVAPSEASEIDARTPAWATALLALLPGLRGLAPSLAARPLRCVWVSQGADVWAPGCAPGALPFTPLVALSASQPLAGPGRRAAGFVYVPGAGDDEESWAGGLSPGAFWAQRRLARGERPSHAPGPAASPASAPRASPGACLPPAGVGALGVAASAPRLRSAPLAVAPLGTSGLGGCGGDDGALLAAASFAALRGGAWPHAVVLLEAVVGEARLEQPLTPSAAGAAAAAAAAPRTLALLVPPRGTKRSPQPLAEALPGLLLFARAALGATPPVPLVVACADGCTVAPAALAALLAACFREAPGGGGTGAGLRFVGDAGPVTKDGLRRALALLSAHHPDARPSRNLIKQVFAGLGGGAGWRDGEARGV